MEIVGSRRLTPLIVELLDDHGERAIWRLAAPLEYASEMLQTVLHVPAGFITDLASVPRIAVAYMLAGGHANWEAVVHDYLYRERLDLSERQADDVFLEAMESDGEAVWRRQAMYHAVRMFGKRGKK